MACFVSHGMILNGLLLQRFNWTSVSISNKNQCSKNSRTSR